MSIFATLGLYGYFELKVGELDLESYGLGLRLNGLDYITD